MQDIVAEVNRKIEESGNRFTWVNHRTLRYYELRSPIVLRQMIKVTEFTKGDDGQYNPAGDFALPWPDGAPIEATADGFIIGDRDHNRHGDHMTVTNVFDYRYRFIDG